MKGEVIIGSRLSKRARERYEVRGFQRKAKWAKAKGRVTSDVCAFGSEAHGHARHSGPPPGVGGTVTTSRYRPVTCVTVRGGWEGGRWGTDVGRRV